MGLDYCNVVLCFVVLYCGGSLCLSLVWCERRKLTYLVCYMNCTVYDVYVMNDCFCAQVSCGEAHALCVTSRGRLYAWGQNSCGQVQ